MPDFTKAILYFKAFLFLDCFYLLHKGSIKMTEKMGKYPLKINKNERLKNGYYWIYQGEFK